MYTDQIREQISQGDVLLDVPIIYVGAAPAVGQSHQVKVIPGPAIILTRDCEYDKDKKKAPYAMVVKVNPLSSLPPDQHPLVRGEVPGKKVLNIFYLPEVPGSLPESYADFRAIDRVAKELIEDLSKQGKRIASISDEARRQLQAQIAVFFGMEYPPKT